MSMLLFYLVLALGISFLCSILEAVLLSVNFSFIYLKEQEGSQAAKTLKNLKNKIDRIHHAYHLEKQAGAIGQP